MAEIMVRHLVGQSGKVGGPRAKQMQKRLRRFSRLNRQFLKNKGTERGRQRLDSLVIESGGGSAIHNQRCDVLLQDIDLKEKRTRVGLIAKEQVQNARQLR